MICVVCIQFGMKPVSLCKEHCVRVICQLLIFVQFMVIINMVRRHVTPVLYRCIFTSYRQQGCASSKTLLQQNPPVVNWGCQLTLAYEYCCH